MLKSIIGCVAVLLLMLFCIVPAFAFDARGGETVTIGKEEVIDGDLYVAGNTIIVDGTVNGDLWACGRVITINGVVTGSVMGASETITITGDIRHALRAVGKTLNINGNVDGDALVAGSDILVGSTARIMGTLLFGSGTANIDGLVGSDIIGGSGEVTIAGEVKGDVKLGADKLTLSPTANIQGNLTYTSDEKAKIHPDAQIVGDITYKFPEVKEKKSPFILFSGIGFKVIGFLMAFVTGLVLILLVPERMRSIAEYIRRKPGPSVGWGVIILIVTPIVSIIVCVTVIGLPVGLIALTLYGIAIYLCQIVVGLFIGRLIIGFIRKVDSRAIMIGALVLGLVILKSLMLIPFLGFFIGLATVLFGLGAMVFSGMKQRIGAQEKTTA